MKFLRVLVATVCLCSSFSTVGAFQTQTATTRTASATPVRIQIPRALVDAPIEEISVEEGVVESPTGVWTVGWIVEGAALNEKDPAIFWGYSDLTITGPSVFYYLDQLVAGDTVTVSGSDNAFYEYEVVSNELFAPTDPISDIFAPPQSEPDEWILLLTNSFENVDPASPTYWGTRAVKAVKSGMEDSLGERDTAQTDSVAQCSALQALPPQYLYADFASLSVPQAQPTDAQLRDGLQSAQSTYSPGCDIELKQAITLPDGNVIALVGPNGTLPVEGLTGVLESPTVLGPYPERAGLFAYVLFVAEGGGWGLYQPPAKPY